MSKQFAPALIKVFQKLVKDLIVAQRNSDERLLMSQIIEVCVVLLERTIMGTENKKPLFSGVILLCEKLEPADSVLLTRLVSVCGGWVLDNCLTSKVRKHWRTFCIGGRRYRPNNLINRQH